MDKKIFLDQSIISNKEELTKATKNFFEDMDTNHSNDIDIDEFHKYMEETCKVLNIHFEEKECHEIFISSDLDKNNSITPNEAESLYINLSNYLSKKAK